MLKQTARFASFALLMLAASAAPLTGKATSTQFDGPNPYPPNPPSSCVPFPLPCQSGAVR
jgi:hypothetical protein